MIPHDDTAHLTTEGRNPASHFLDQLSTLELVQLLNQEDSRVASAVARELPRIAQAVDAVVERWQRGGRLIYLGAGTSGRLGVLDAAECPPTFNTPPDRVVGVIAGGTPALTRAVEGAEDRADLAETDLAALRLTENDAIVGISTSGRANYALRGVEIARQAGALTIGITCNVQAKLNEIVDIAITPVVGPEVLSGSTRLKAGTATKMVLNMLSTGVMVRLGKTAGNLMIDLRATNSKLRARACRIIETLTGMSTAEADRLLEECQGSVKQAVEKAGMRAGRTSSNPALLLGIDGGGTGTTALLAERTAEGYRVLGRGDAGPANRQAVGDGAMLAALDQAVTQAFAAAKLHRCKVGAACVGLAGADRPEDRAVLERWANSTGLAETVKITNDAELVLAAGTPEGWGLAIIAGTGSIAYGKDQQGTVVRAGGWGYLMGDKGSAYCIAVDALQVCAIEVDTGLTLDGEEITEGNALLPLVMKHWKLDEPRQLVKKVYGSGLDRSAFAQLAPLILQAYQTGNRDPVELVETNAAHLGGDAAIVMRKLFDQTPEVPVALAGGVFVHCPAYGELVVSMVERCRASEENPRPLGAVTVVEEPAEGAVRLALKAVGMGATSGSAHPVRG